MGKTTPLASGSNKAVPGIRWSLAGGLRRVAHALRRAATSASAQAASSQLLRFAETYQEGVDKEHMFENGNDRTNARVSANMDLTLCRVSPRLTGRMGPVFDHG